MARWRRMLGVTLALWLMPAGAWARDDGGCNTSAALTGKMRFAPLWVAVALSVSFLHRRWRRRP